MPHSPAEHIGHYLPCTRLYLPALHHLNTSLSSRAHQASTNGLSLSSQLGTHVLRSVVATLHALTDTTNVSSLYPALTVLIELFWPHIEPRLAHWKHQEVVQRVTSTEDDEEETNYNETEEQQHGKGSTHDPYADPSNEGDYMDVKEQDAAAILYASEKPRHRIDSASVDPGVHDPLQLEQSLLNQLGQLLPQLRNSPLALIGAATSSAISSGASSAPPATSVSAFSALQLVGSRITAALVNALLQDGTLQFPEPVEGATQEFDRSSSLVFALLSSVPLCLVQATDTVQLPRNFLDSSESAQTVPVWKLLETVLAYLGKLLTRCEKTLDAASLDNARLWLFLQWRDRIFLLISRAHNTLLLLLSSSVTSEAALRQNTLPDSNWWLRHWSLLISFLSEHRRFPHSNFFNSTVSKSALSYLQAQEHLFLPHCIESHPLLLSTVLALAAFVSNRLPSLSKQIFSAEAFGAIVDVVKNNLASRLSALRQLTMDFFTYFAVLPFTQQAQAANSKTSSNLRGNCPLIETLRVVVGLLSAELPNLSVEKDVRHRLIQLKQMIASRRVPPPYVDLLGCAMIGVLRVKLNVVWAPAQDVLAAVGELHPKLLWPKLSLELRIAAEESRIGCVPISVVLSQLSPKISSENSTPPEFLQLPLTTQLVNSAQSLVSDSARLSDALDYIRYRLDSSAALYCRESCTDPAMYFELLVQTISDRAGFHTFGRTRFAELSQIILHFFKTELFRDAQHDGDSFAQSASSSPSDEIQASQHVVDPAATQFSSSFLPKKLRVLLKLFASVVQNPTKLLGVADVEKYETVFYRICSFSDPDTQSLALDCLSCWQHAWLLPYMDSMKRLVQDQTFREEITVFTLRSGGSIVDSDRLSSQPSASSSEDDEGEQIEGESNEDPEAIEKLKRAEKQRKPSARHFTADQQARSGSLRGVLDEHRHALIPLIIRLLYPKLLKRKIAQVKTPLHARRAAILAFFGNNLTPLELAPLMTMLFQPFSYMLSKCSSSGQNIAALSKAAKMDSVVAPEFEVSPLSASASWEGLSWACYDGFGRDASPPMQLGFLTMLEFLLAQMRTVMASYLPQVCTTLLHILHRAEVRLSALRSLRAANEVSLDLLYVRRFILFYL